MTVETVWSISPEDLTAVVFECKKCGAKVSIPIHGTEGLRIKPVICEHCHQEWLSLNTSEDRTVETFVATLRTLAPTLKNRQFNLRLEMKRPDDAR